MGIVRDIFGYLMGLAFCAAALVLCWLAWLGLEDMFGWRWALGGVVVSLLMRINFPVIVGLYFYAYNIMGWPQPQAFAFALPGLLILLPGIAMEVFGLLVGTAARR